ncbi:MAG: hypothetical protein KGR17_07340 [Acidobacteria bacterium]|nr:hypothetical protein [Acidobacteriota bacterium]
MDAPRSLWICRALWAVLPVTLGDLLARVLSGHDGPGRWVVIVAAWLGWAVGLGATLVRDPRALTVLRVLAPVPVVVALVLAAAEPPGVAGWVGVAAAALLAVVAFAAPIGEWAIDGGSYGDEHRSPLRCPTALLAGPVPLTWALTVGPLVGAAVAVLAEAWVPAVALAVLGTATAWFGGRSLDRLTRRALVFVPAGVTLVDPFALAEPILLARRSVTRIGPAPADTTALDLSVGATGLIVQVDLDTPVSLVPVTGRQGVAEAVETTAVLVAPTRPGVFLRHAEERRLQVRRN